MGNRPIRSCFLIRALDFGGAQRQLAELVARLDKTRFEVSVLTFYPGGLFWNAVGQVPGVRLVCLGKTGRWDVVRFLARLTACLRRLRPDVIHGYLGVANEWAWIGGRAVRARVIWGLRSSDVDVGRYDWTLRASTWMAARLSAHVDLVIANSHAGLRHHVRRHGFRFPNTAVVPNGIDTGRFRPRPEDRDRVRRTWGVADPDFLIGLVARLDPKKDHDTFLDGMARLARRHPRVRVVCVGIRPSQAARYRAGSRAAGALGARLRWEPVRDDMECVFPALDALVLSSAFGEGFPNVVGEAMAAEVPCIVTDVGDAARLLADPDRTVPPRNPEQLMRACDNLMARSADERRRLAANDRRRIVEHFGAERLVARTAALLQDTVDGRRPPPRRPA